MKQLFTFKSGVLQMLEVRFPNSTQQGETSVPS